MDQNYGPKFEGLPARTQRPAIRPAVHNDELITARIVTSHPSGSQTAGDVTENGKDNEAARNEAGEKEMKSGR